MCKVKPIFRHLFLNLSLTKLVWGHTMEKSKTNATSVAMHSIGQVNWGDIWKHTAEKSWTNATNVTTHPPMQALWGDIWKHRMEKIHNKCTKKNTTYPQVKKTLKIHWKALEENKLTKVEKSNSIIWYHFFVEKCGQFLRTAITWTKRPIEEFFQKL